MNLYDQPGEPFGHAWIEERTAIEDHVLRRLHHSVSVHDARVQDRVNRIQLRLHKYDLTFAERSRQWSIDQAARSVTPATFSREQLQHLVDTFVDANDPVSREIAAVAERMILTGW